MKNSDSQPDFEEYTYKSLLKTIFKDRRLRIERKHRTGIRKKEAGPSLTLPPNGVHYQTK